ncbi:hypothetical protein [Salsuginibacillus kocurii]|uniref:hypothetical protein n=1 Tax=Salsuginibacillus kocurii TaxID=427078 RepID=UPI00035F58EC|nr:hypothetical protein [Salsuginibacillus kocurii]
MSKSIHLYLSRYQEHLDYLRANNQESPSWQELREEELPAFLPVIESSIQIDSHAVVRDWNDTGGLEPGAAVRCDVTLQDDTRLSLTGYYIADEADWFPTENPPIHLDDHCGFCNDILGLGNPNKRKEDYCMLPFLEKKHLFEQVLTRHHQELYG